MAKTKKSNQQRDPYVLRLSALVRGELDKLGPGATGRALAERAGFSEVQICRVLAGTGGLGAENFQKLQTALWWVKEDTWRTLIGTETTTPSKS